ncbi:MAG: HPr family phosphocarrier protein [Eubacterium sp.]
MYRKELSIVNPTGLHARPAAEFCKMASQFESDIQIKRLAGDSKEGNAKSVIMLMSMGLSKGTSIEISAEGVDETDAVEALAQLISDGFGEI